MADPVLPLFVYGTLRSGQRNHTHYLGGHCTRIEPAVLAGAVLHQGPGYPYAVADPDPGRRVRGELITVRPADFARVLTALDELEGCRPDGTGYYVRLRRPVIVTAHGERVAAWVYLAGPELSARLRARPAPIPSGDWVDPA
ncbi:gamma-glutamylcyclotransferase family protein [Kitasatospora sp. NBC_01266]|uniref:gamma-glutamylcyclotransferase family protein n=1 Tax=Kitasatospora sp. NBC_01266 TaxID=2903572 RepID=UPI002E364740|nr:gamma-glutamylcyclotransferase family protein [Kitasatospora sp. NBC_01266]